MLELYHWEPNAAGARVMIALKEKGLDFTSRYVDVLAFEQHGPEFLKLNETGETPVLVKDGEAYFESSYVCEFIDEAFGDPALMPSDPLGRWRAREWQKYVDDHIAASVGELAWQAYGPAQLKGRNIDLDKAVASIASRPRREVWQSAIKGYPVEQQARDRGRIELLVKKMQADLEQADFLAGPASTLADIAVYAYAAYLPRLTPELVSEAASPTVMAWLKRMAARPAVKAAMAMARTPDPFAVAAPGPEHVRWG